MMEFHYLLRRTSTRESIGITVMAWMLLDQSSYCRWSHRIIEALVCQYVRVWRFYCSSYLLLCVIGECIKLYIRGRYGFREQVEAFHCVALVIMITMHSLYARALRYLLHKTEYRVRSTLAHRLLAAGKNPACLSHRDVAGTPVQWLHRFGHMICLWFYRVCRDVAGALVQSWLLNSVHIKGIWVYRDS